MSTFLEKIGGILGGGTAGKIADIFTARITNKAEAAAAQLDLEKVLGAREHELKVGEQQNEQERERMFNERTVQLEGTASDLKAVPYVGAIIILLRGAFRPLFAYLTAYFDWLYFKGGMTFDERQATLILAINLLVLVFFFGERTLKNIMPIIVELFAVKAGK